MRSMWCLLTLTDAGHLLLGPFWQGPSVTRPFALRRRPKRVHHPDSATWVFPDVCPMASSDCVWPRKPALTNAPKGLRHGVAPWVLARVRRWVHAGVCPWVVLAYLLPRMTALASTPKSIRLGVSPGVPAGACPWVFAAANAPAILQSPLLQLATPV